MSLSQNLTAARRQLARKPLANAAAGHRGDGSPVAGKRHVWKGYLPEPLVPVAPSSEPSSRR